MATLLHVQASPRADESSSIQLARAFLVKLTELHSDLHVDTLDLFAADLPEFAAPAAKAKYAVMAGVEPTDEAGRAWAGVIDIVNRLKAADKLVISSPMWNFSIPYRLKHWIDIITQPGLTFNFSPETGYTGLVTGRPAALLLPRGGEYAPGTPTQGLDMQLPYLQTLLQFIGFEDIHPILVQPTLHAGPDVAAARLADAVAQAEKLAETFGR
jgi:FMN-dependent NADH-azoreductase